MPSRTAALPSETWKQKTGPRHVAFIVDGNRRWARTRGLRTDRGHEAGADKIVEALQWCDEAGLEATSWWLLSPENLQRPATEIDGLLRIITDLTTELTARRCWRIRHIGDPSILPDYLARALSEAQDRTDRVNGPRVNLAIGYSGRRDITSAVLELATSGAPVTAASIGAALVTCGEPDPDLLIRTSGEQRLSDFMIWQTALTELYFCPTLWPDFTREDFARALASYAGRERRNGR